LRRVSPAAVLRCGCGRRCGDDPPMNITEPVYGLCDPGQGCLRKCGTPDWPTSRYSVAASEIGMQTVFDKWVGRPSCCLGSRACAVCVCVCVYANLCSCVFMCVHKFVFMCVRVCLHAFVCIRAYCVCIRQPGWLATARAAWGSRCNIDTFVGSRLLNCLRALPVTASRGSDRR